jgi:GTPase SAR1 family protein
LQVVNLDPAAENFDYQPLADIRDLIQVDDVMEDAELKFGPNGGLVFCLEFLMENLNWLEENLEQDVDDDYILFDCPGQIELYTHLPVMRRLVDTLQGWNFRVCAVFLIDSHFMVDGAKFISGATVALSVMCNLEVPHVNVLSKMDLLSKASRKQIDGFLHPDTRELTAEAKMHAGGKFAKLTEALGKVLEDYSLVRFFPLDITDEENVGDLLQVIDNTIQYGEDCDVRTDSLEDLREPREDEDGGGGGDE